MAAGDPVVLGFDGSWSGDSTGIVGCTIPHTTRPKPYLFVVASWEKPKKAQDWRVPVLQVEDVIRQACTHLNVREVACDPFRFERSLETLEQEGLPIVEFRTNDLRRIIPACQTFQDAVLDEMLAHDGDPRLARHVTNAVVKTDNKGPRIVKESKGSTRYIDLSVAAVIALYRALQMEAEAPQPRVYDLEDY